MSNLTYMPDGPLTGQALKDWFVAETIWHKEQDLLLKGKYCHNDEFDSDADISALDVEEFRGCAIGCSVLSLKRKGLVNGVSFADHRSVARALGWPEWLCHLEDNFFEGLPENLSSDWPRRLAAAVPVGKDISSVELHFKVFTQQRNRDRVANDLDFEERQLILNAIDQCIAALRSGTGLKSAEKAAEAAAEKAIWPAAKTAAESATWSVSTKVCSAWVAARLLAWPIARQAAAEIEILANQLIKLLEEAS